MKLVFKKKQIYRYSQPQDGWSVIGVVTNSTKGHITFRDLILEQGNVEIMKTYRLELPLSFKSPKFELLGTLDDFPEYTL